MRCFHAALLLLVLMAAADARGRRVASGVYVARLETPGGAPQTRKMVLVK